MLIDLCVPWNRPSLSRKRLWKIKVKYIALCLNASAVLQNAWKTSHYLVFIGNCLTCSHLRRLHQFIEWFIINTFKMV